MNLQRIKLSAGMHLIDTQVALTPEQRQIGLMFRKEMPQHEGMIFVFEQPAQQCFWMKNTLLPLTAAFVAVPALFGIPTIRTWEWVAALGGAGTGATVAVLVRSRFR